MSMVKTLNKSNNIYQTNTLIKQVQKNTR